MAETTFWFTRFQIDGITTDVTDFDPSASRDDLVRDTILEYVRSNEAVTESATGKWYFGAIDDRGDMLYGKFGKEYTDESAAYDESRGDFIDEAGEGIDASYSMFALNFPKRLLIYNTRNRVGYQQFRRNFADGYNERNSGTMTTEFMKNTADLETVISERRVRNANFELEPSNPSSEPEWESLDEHIQEMLAEKLGVDVEAMEGSGLNFDDEFLAEVTSMSQSEYGEFEVYYDEDGYVKKITSGEGEPIIRRREEPEGIGGLREISRDLVDFASTFL
ncbi:hypothetical protein [Halorientalis halophila]|uniref:hypothetical protein n=1 Tax=Halorientalis halophila TaxID=3108499 RepID=UPI00300BC9B0